MSEGAGQGAWPVDTDDHHLGSRLGLLGLGKGREWAHSTQGLAVYPASVGSPPGARRVADSSLVLGGQDARRV